MGHMVQIVTIGKMIKGQWQAARALIGWSQSDLAEKVGVAPLTIKRLEAGHAAVSDSIRARAQAALEAAGVEFTNGERPGVRMKAAPAQSAEVPPDFAPGGVQTYVPSGPRRNTKVHR
jgi:transcriptional regulator with XRE-family HTH domain